MNIVIKRNISHTIVYLKTECGVNIKAELVDNGEDLNEAIRSFCKDVGTYKITFEE